MLKKEKRDKRGDETYNHHKKDLATEKVNKNLIYKR
jgi:hypothetical protein